MKSTAKKAIRRVSRGFESVDGGYIAREGKKRFKPEHDAKNDWDKEHLPAHSDLRPGHYIIWLAATDVQGHTSQTGSSACAWRIRGEGKDVVGAWPSKATESSEKKAYVAALAGALDNLPSDSTAEIICRDDYIVGAINSYLRRWERQSELRPRPGEKYPRRTYGLVWAHVVRAIDRIAPTRPIVARRPMTARDSDDQIIEELRERARAQRQPRGN